MILFCPNNKLPHKIFLSERNLIFFLVILVATGRYNMVNRENSRVLSCGLALRGIPHAPGQPAWVLNGIHCCIGYLVVGFLLIGSIPIITLTLY